MGRETSPYVVGEFWLDKRPDSDNWQIFWYDTRGRTTRSVSARTASLEDAKDKIRQHAVENARPIESNPAEAMVAQILASYWREHGINRASSEQIKASIQHWAAFMALEEERMKKGATKVADITPKLISRFVRWRMAPHKYTLGDKMFKSKGVSGDSAGRNIDDLRSAINWAWKNGEIASAPYIPPIDPSLKSGPRDLVLTIEQLGKIVAYPNDRIRRLAVGMIATLARPEAVLAWKMPDQIKSDTVFDTNPPGKKQTKKYNPVVPIIEPFRPWLERDGVWIEVQSLKTAWRTMRTNLDLPAATVAKTIRHTIITELQRRGAPEVEIETFAGHKKQTTTRRNYTHLRPDYLSSAKAVLEEIWGDIDRASGGVLRNSCGTVGDGGKVVDLRKRRKTAV